MAKIYNTDCTRGLAQNARIEQSRDNVPNELAEKIVPTFESNPELLRRTNIINRTGSTVTGNASYILPVNKDFYLTGIQAAYIKDAACDQATGTGLTISATPFGNTTQTILCFPTITTTAQSDNIFVSIVPPVRLERGSSITYNSSYTAGVMSRSMSVYGYTTDISTN